MIEPGPLILIVEDETSVRRSLRAILTDRGYRIVEAENAARSQRAGKISAEVKLIGDRPTGATREDALIVEITSAAVRAAGYMPILGASSTDSNVPISLGIPAVTIGSGGDGGRAHAVDEWIDVAKPESLRGMSVGLAALLAMAGS